MGVSPDLPVRDNLSCYSPLCIPALLALEPPGMLLSVPPNSQEECSDNSCMHICVQLYFGSG